MKTILLIITSGLVLLGCSATSTGVKEGSNISEKPDWVQSMGRYEKGIGTVGIAPKSGAGTQMQVNEALLAARTQLTLIYPHHTVGNYNTIFSLCFIFIFMLFFIVSFLISCQ